MYVTQVDDLFDGILNKFNSFLIDEKAFQKLNSDTNFVKFQNQIIAYIKKFIETIPKKDIVNIIKNESYYDSIVNIIKRYCAYYIYLGIGYFYEGGRDLYITNIIEASRYQRDSTFQINNFFNSENNSKIISFYNDIKNFISLLQYKTIDKIKIILTNNPLRYESTIKLFNDLGEDYIVEYFLIKDNFHNVMKALIFKQIYLKEEKNEILNMLNQQEKENAEYKYIEVVVSNEKKIVDFNVIQKLLTYEELRAGLAEEIYSYLEEIRDTKEIIIKENMEFVNYLFSNKIIIPITEEFLRYHKDTEKYDPESLVESSNIAERDATKIKYIVSKMNNVRNYYSPLLDKNPKLKLDTAKLFYKPMDPKMAILYNADEEIKIIQKLEISEQTSDIDLLVDLENIRKYAYVNFKNFSRDGIKIRPMKTIEGIRSIVLDYKSNTKQPIDTRIGHDMIDMNVIGIAWNPSFKPLNCFFPKDMIDVRSKMQNENGYEAMIKVMKKTFGKKNIDNLFVWMFNNKKDKPLSKTYINFSTSDVANNIKIMLGELYNVYIDIVYHKLEQYLDSLKETNLWEFNNIMKGYNKKYFNFNLMQHLTNILIEKIIINKIPELEIIPDEVDSMIPGKRDKLIILPVLDRKKDKKTIILLGKKEDDIVIDMSKKSIPVCNHYVKWLSIMKISRKSDDFNQAIFDYVKQYVKLDEHGDYICKSCNEGVNLYKYVHSASYNEEMDTFMTTSIAVNQKLEEISKYAKYMRSIRNIEKSIEKFAYSLDIIAYLGNDPIIKLRRKMIIKDTIDLILIHTKWLRIQPKNRIEMANKKYGIGKDLTNLFFFELKDEIFLTSSTDTDYYKIIKYNNIMAYLVFIIITELNSGQIISLKEDKRYNYFTFKKFGVNLFNDMFLRINQKEKIPIMKIPLLAYILYYFSGMMVSYRLWLYNDKAIEPKDKPMFLVGLQKTIIHTVMDLFNTLVEANLDQREKTDDKSSTPLDYLYEIINTRIADKIKHTYNDDQLLKRVEMIAMKNINFDETTKKVTFLTKKIPTIDLNIEFKPMERIKERCDLETSEIERIPFKSQSNEIDVLTNCMDGRFHVWNYKSGDMICNLCSKQYNELLKMIKKGDTETEKQTTNDYLDKIKLINLKKLAKKYCISGDMHDLDSDGKCSRCKVNINTYNPIDKELKQLERNIEIRTNDVTIMQINRMRQYNEDIAKKIIQDKETLNRMNRLYETETNNKLEYYIEKFVNRLSQTLGPKIKVKDTTIYLKETVYIIDHDYFGNEMRDSRQQPFVILSSENKINLTKSHPLFNQDILWYRDKASKVFVYYNSITLQYLGYSEDNKTLKKTKNNASLKIEHSLIHSIMYLGYENQYFNLYHANKMYIRDLTVDLGSNEKDVVENILRNRLSNLKQIIERVVSIITNIKNGGKVTSKYNVEEKEIVTEFTKKLKNFNMTDIFADSNYIARKFAINTNLPERLNISLSNNYMNLDQLNAMQNTDNKIIFFLIYNFNKLLDSNIQPAIQSELAHLIIIIIRFIYNQYYRPYSNYNIRKFDFELINETPYIDEKFKVVGHYQELLTQQEIDDPDRKEAQYSDQEAAESLDIDDYEKDDDIDGSFEALDGYEN
jgi:hypothetical protein